MNVAMSSSARPGDARRPDAMLTVERGLRVLRAFRSERMPLSNAELVSRTGLPKATVSRLTSTLLQLGFLRHGTDGRQFELGMGPLGIGHAFVQASPLVRKAEPFMQALADRLDVSVALATGHDLQMLYVAYCTGRRIATLRLGVGSQLPMAVTAIGRAWLWGLPAVQGIRAGFEELAATGTCFAIGGYQRDAFGIALPVRLGRARTLMALSCGAVEVEPRLSAARRRIAPELRKAAVQFEHLLADEDGVL